jgi:hypothetical protein
MALYKESKNVYRLKIHSLSFLKRILMMSFVMCVLCYSIKHIIIKCLYIYFMVIHCEKSTVAAATRQNYIDMKKIIYTRIRKSAPGMFPDRSVHSSSSMGSSGVEHFACDHHTVHPPLPTNPLDTVRTSRGEKRRIQKVINFPFKKKCTKASSLMMMVCLHFWMDVHRTRKTRTKRLYDTRIFFVI